MEIIVPAAGVSSRFPNMKPKYLLFDYKHELMLFNSLKQFINSNHRIHIGILAEHDQKYNASELIKHEIKECKVYILDEKTRGPADTVYKILKMARLERSEIFIKDCDSYFDHELNDSNYVCVSKISKSNLIRNLSSKSYINSNTQGIITNIVEKEVVSDTFCVGGYKFSSAELFKREFEELNIEKEVFVSDVVGRCISQKHIFFEAVVSNYIDVGTAQDWFEYNDKPVIFCDIDGTIIKAQSRVGDNSYDKEPVALLGNVNRLLMYQNNGAQIIFTTSRQDRYYQKTHRLLENLGFTNFILICGLLNSKRIIINDYNNSNPYPRAVAVNLKRDADNLIDFI